MFNLYEQLKSMAKENGKATININSDYLAGPCTLWIDEIDTNSWDTMMTAEFFTSKPIPEINPELEWVVDYCDVSEADDEFGWHYKTKSIKCGLMADLLGTLQKVTPVTPATSSEPITSSEEVSDYDGPNDLVAWALTHGCDVMDMTDLTIYHGIRM